jgi:hypothetical protein
MIFSFKKFKSALVLKKVLNQTNAISSSEFKRIVNSYFKPKIEKFGFVGKDWRYTKITDNKLIHEIVFGPSRYGGEFCIDLIVKSDINVKYGDLEHCVYQFWIRLTPKKGLSDYWWRYKGTEFENHKILDSIIKLYQKRGMEFFKRFSDYPNDIKRISISDINKLDSLKKKYISTNQTKLMWSIDLVAFNELEKDYHKVIDFAKFGLKEIETGYGSYWIPYFEEKIKNYAQHAI